MAAPEKILLDFERAAINAFRSAFPNATQSVIRKVNQSVMKEDYEKNDSLRLAIRYLPALAMFHSSDVAEVFLILSGNMPSHEKMQESYCILSIRISEADDGQVAVSVMVLPSFQ